jgi:cytochrome c peroxidase
MSMRSYRLRLTGKQGTAIAEVKRQTGRDLTRFDLDFDLPDRFLPEFPVPIYLTTRPDLGDMSRGQLVTTDNYYELFNGILNPKQLEGLRLLLTPLPQQHFNATADRRSEHPSLGVACFDCHQDGHTNGATHLVGDIRPQQFRHRIETKTSPSPLGPGHPPGSRGQTYEGPLG